MKKKPDRWHEIADLINKDKKRALDDFHIHEFVPGALPARRTDPLSSRRLIMRPVLMASAAALLLAAGLVAFWQMRGSWQKVPAAADPGNLLANSFLYDSGSEPKDTKPEPRTRSSFALALSAWTAAAESHADDFPIAEPVDPSAPIEHGDPTAVQRKIEKLIRENTLERVLGQFCQVGREV